MSSTIVWTTPCRFCGRCLEYKGLGRKTISCCGDLPCQRAYARERDHQRVERLKAQGLTRRTSTKAAKRAAGSILDLTTEQIERMLARRALTRRNTRSWLRIEDPWQQRDGAALHQAALVTHGVDVDGSLL